MSRRSEQPPNQPAAPAPPRRSGAAARPLLDLAALLVVAWLGLAGIDWLLALVVDGTVIRIGGFSGSTTIRLLCLEWLLLAAAVVAIGVPLGLFAACAVPRPGPRARTRMIIRVVLFALLCGAYFLFAASWSVFRSTGVFLDGDSLAFMANDPVLIFKHIAHMEPDALIIVPLAVATGAALTAWLGRLVPRRRTAVPAVLVAAGAVACAACLVGASRGVAVPADDRTSTPHPVGGMSVTRADFYAECRDDRTGPVLHAIADYRRRRAPIVSSLANGDGVPVDRRPLISMETYLDRVDESSVRSLNVAVIIVESLRPDQLKVLGGPRPVMNAVDDLARRGRTYSFHYAQASHSNYADLCPLSSHYPLRSPRMHYYPRTPTYPRVLLYDILQARGYDTALISSQNENWGCMLNYLDTGGLDHIFHAETWDGPAYVPDVEEDLAVATFLGGTRRSGKIDDKITINEAIRWIDERDGAPWFMYVNLQNSHTPYVTPPDFPRKYSPEKLPFVIRYNNYPRDQARLVKGVYSDSLRYVDAQIERLLDHLEARGDLERTIIAITGDTGESFYERGFAAHGNAILDDQVRVPLVIHAPGLEPMIDDRPAQQIDVPPTILDLLGLPPHPSFQGLSLLDAESDPDRSMFLVVHSALAHQYGIVRGGFKLIYDQRNDVKVLMDLRNDPREMKNWIKAYPDVARDLENRLGARRRHQIDYYRDPSQHARWYPPVVVD